MEHREGVIAFGPFRLLPVQGQLWKDEERLKVRLRPLAVLAYLAQHPERVVPVEELRQAIWGGTYVSRTVIRVCVRELRQALGDEMATPHYIETVGRQGYRFIGYRFSPPLATPPPVPSSQFSVSSTDKTGEQMPQLATGNWSLPTPFVGRERELAQLQQWFAHAQQWQRQLAFVSGDTGIGKTTLARQFLAHLAHMGPLWVGQGQCVGPYGQGEAYLPLLEALIRLSREVGVGPLKAVLLQHAPMWLAQLPALTESAERVELHRQVAGATQERMLRELCEALEVLTAERSLVLFLEDLQWSDTATVAWLAAVARRLEPSRLLIIGTYRPIDVIVHTHPLRGLVQETRAHRLARELRLELFTVAAVTEYVHHRLAHSPVAAELGPYLYQRTAGNPVFLIVSLESLIQQGVVGQEGDQWVVHGDFATLAATVPEDLQHLITKQLEDLAAEDRQILAVASVSGETFTAAEVAAGCQQELAAVEARCEQLARRGQFIAEAGWAEWPDGTFTPRYNFRHALYQQGVYAHLGGGQKVRLHRCIGERKEAGYGERVGEIAVELALRFEQGRDYGRAVRYRQIAAEQALRRSGQRETLMHCEKGLVLLSHLSATPERARQELALRVSLVSAQSAIYGLASEELGRNLERARMLCQELDETVDLIPIIIGIGRLHLWRADRIAADKLAEQECRLLEHVDDPALALQLHIPLGSIEFNRGALHRAHEHFERALRLFDPEQHDSLFLSFSGDPLTVALINSSWSAWLSGWPDQARTRVEKALARAAEVSHPFTLVYTLILAAMARQFLREPNEAWRLAHRGVTLAREYGFSLYTALGAVVQNCAALQCGELQVGLATITEVLSAYRATGARLFLPFFLAFLAEGYLQVGQIQDGLQVVTEALQLTETNLASFWEAELYRLKGELSLQQFTVQGAKVKARKSLASLVQRLELETEACFQQAIEVARRQGAKSLELRAVMSLSRLWQQQGKREAARKVLAKTYGWFSEGFDTKDLQEAKALLVQLT
jgi:DNA-binding winged helix-turn-helix (wHTH) protein/predicted ATPase